MLRLVETGRSDDAVDAAAVDVLRALFEGLTGTPPRSLRAYRDDDALLLLLRYERSPAAATDPPVEIALMALAQLVAEAVTARTGRGIAAGGVSLCAPQGLAVLAFSVAEDPPCDAGLRLAG
jgi:hypothetical protein